MSIRLKSIKHALSQDYGTAAISPDDVRWLVSVADAALKYAENYMRDEADDPDVCVTDDQHAMARDVFDALGMELGARVPEPCNV